MTVAAQSGAGGGLAEAHQRMLADSSLQFGFRTVPPPKPPEWQQALDKALRPFLSSLNGVLHAMGPWVGYIIWGLVAIGAAFIVFLIVREIVRTKWPERFGGAKAPKLEPGDWRPTEAEARALLEDVDRLAAQGRFAEAVHLLLHRSIQDIQGKRPNLVRPALTSRDISGLSALPERARQAFSAIARVVERSHFGGRPVDASAFAECRRTYEAFAFPEVWA
jgi:hypothetical protein